jgi:hypothetical protein
MTQWADTKQNVQNQAEGSTGSGSSDRVWNILTALVLFGIMVFMALGAYLFNNPRSALNPFPPPELPALLVLPSLTPTPKVLPPTWTVTPSVTNTATITPPAPVAGSDAVEVTPGPRAETQEATDQPSSRYAFLLQGEVKAIDGTIFRPEHDCKWMGVAGQAFDLQGRPATGITVQVSGSLGRKYIDLISLTGTALWYGQAGYEVFLSDTLVDSKDTMWLRLMDQSGLPLSGKVYFPTSKDCQKNLVVVNFKQVR